MSKIPWCDETINPIIGCTKCSPGCDNCYAERMAWRLAHNPKTKAEYEQVVADGKWNGRIVWRPGELEKVSKWKKPKRIFVGSMGDVFHESVPWHWILQLNEFFAAHRQHTFMLLTKRPWRAVKFQKAYSSMKWSGNVWMGTTVCNQSEIKNIEILGRMDVAVRFISVEPMLGVIDLGGYCDTDCLDWVICGGETGLGAREMKEDWGYWLLEQCEFTDMPFFFKGWGGVRKRKDDDLIGGERYREFPVGRIEHG